jgi:hypothetical protein
MFSSLGIVNLNSWRHKRVEFQILKRAGGPEQRRSFGLYVADRYGKFGISILALSRLQRRPIAQQAGNRSTASRSRLG